MHDDDKCCCGGDDLIWNGEKIPTTEQLTTVTKIIEFGVPNNYDYDLESDMYRVKISHPKSNYYGNGPVCGINVVISNNFIRESVHHKSIAEFYLTRNQIIDLQAYLREIMT